MSTKNIAFEDLIRKKLVTFYSYGRKLKTNIKDFGQYNRDLIAHLGEQSGNKITIAGDGLEKYLYPQQNMYSLADFAVQLWFKGSERYHQDFGIHIAVDLDVLNPHYLRQRKPDAEGIVNFFGQVVAETSSWVPDIPYVEKVWNFALCNAVGEMLGSPGYEYPRSDKSFRREMENHAQHYVIGTPEQIKRYEKYALEYLKEILARTEILQKNPRHIFEDSYDLRALETFEDPYDLRTLETVVGDAKRIAENVVRFSVNYRKKM